MNIFMFFLGVAFPFVVIGLWRLIKIGFGYLILDDFILTPYKNSDLTEKETYIRDTVESVNIVFPLYPIQNTKSIKCKFDIKLKPGMIDKDFESEEYNVSRLQLYNMFGGIFLKDIIHCLIVFVRAKLAIRKMMKQLDSK